MKQFIIKGAAIFAIVVTIDIITGLIFKPFYTSLPDKDYPISSIWQLLSNKKADLLILGSSSADRHYDPQMMMDSLGIDVYNGGLAGHDIIYCDLILRSFIEREKPSIVLLDVRPGIIDGSFFSKVNDFRSFYGISKIVTNYYDSETGWQQRLKMKSSLYRYNGGLVDLYRVSKSRINRTRGYRPMENKLATVKMEENNTFNLNVEEYNSLLNIVKSCEDNDIKLILCKSPCTSKNRIFNEWIVDFCDDNKLTLIDEDENTMYYDHPEWFYDGFHLNKVGSAVFTQKLIESLKHI